MTREEAHTLLEVMAIELTGELADIECPVTERTKLLGKQLEAIDMAIEALQTDADRPHGEWYQIKDHKIMGEGYLWHCSICDYKVYQDSSKDYPTENFCPNCGSRMEK